MLFEDAHRESRAKNRRRGGHCVPPGSTGRQERFRRSESERRGNLNQGRRRAIVFEQEEPGVHPEREKRGCFTGGVGNPRGTRHLKYPALDAKKDVRGGSLRVTGRKNFAAFNSEERASATSRKGGAEKGTHKTTRWSLKTRSKKRREDRREVGAKATSD